MTDFCAYTRSFIVNTAAIRHIERTRLTLTDGTNIPVGATATARLSTTT